MPVCILLALKLAYIDILSNRYHKSNILFPLLKGGPLRDSSILDCTWSQS